MRRKILAMVAGTSVAMLATGVAVAAGHFAFFDPSTYRAREKVGEITITVKRDGPVGAGKVDYRTVDGTAKARRDYVPAKGTLRFAEGETEKSFTIQIKDDLKSEGREGFRVKLTNGRGMISVLGDPATVSIPPSDQS